MILAAGLGSRMRPLTDKCPKPLLKAAGKSLIDYHLERLEKLGIVDIAINTHWLADQVELHIRAHWSQRLNIQIFHEQALLETAGGIVNALPALLSNGATPTSDSASDTNDEAFLLINGDVFFDADITHWLDQATKTNFPSAHLLLVSNPTHNLKGDFSFSENALTEHAGADTTSTSGIVTQQKSANTHTYSGIGLYRPSMFEGLTPGKHALGPLLKALASNRALFATELSGYWLDVGTPERLNDLDQHLKS